MLILSLLFACSQPVAYDLSEPVPPGLPTGDTGLVETSTSTTTELTVITEPLAGFVGSPCESVSDCPYEDAVCLAPSEGYPEGMCSKLCEQFCPDATGYPTTLCVTAQDLPDTRGSDGACAARCNFEAYPEAGCREGYGCATTARANDPQAQGYACLPEAPQDLSSCLQELVDRGVPFETSILSDDAPSDQPSLTCHVEEPIRFLSGYQGVDLLTHAGQDPVSVVGSCAFGHALADTIEDVQPRGVTAIRHLGTYVCRTIAGTSTLSRHAYGDAIDIYGVDFQDGSALTLEQDWVHNQSTFTDPGAAWLYDTSMRWHEEKIWTIILTPNYNAAHDNHFHVDLTPGSDFIGLRGPWWIGPSPWPGE